MNPFYKENPDATPQEILKGKLARWGNEQNLRKVALTWIPSPIDETTAKVYDINPEAKNTVFVYKKRKVASKWVNIEYDDKSVREILQALK